MATTSPKVPAVVALAGASAGAEFLCADLQVHTPLDPRFEPPLRDGDASSRAALARAYVERARERGVQLVGITEHNDVSWIEELRYAARGAGLHLLPGFEVESAEGIHVLCLFDPDLPVHQLEDSLARLGLPKVKRDSSELLHLRAGHHFTQLVSFVQDECAGICIAAHMDSDKGLLRAIGGGAKADYWTHGPLLAGQISRPPDEADEGLRRILANEDPSYRRERRLATLMTSDARSLDAIGSKVTWIKLDRVGVEGLRQAFLDPETRVLFADPSARPRGARLLAIRWEGGFLDGVEFAFNEQLNCLIGGRGTGKSTVIESVRFAFDVDARTDDVRASVKTLRESALMSGTKVSLLLETGPPAPKRYVIERTAPHAPFVRDELGHPLPEVEPQQLLKPSVYGQKEIYGVAQDARARLSLVDQFADEELREAARREKAILRATRQNAQAILERRHQLDDADARLAELPSLEQWRQRFREAGFEGKLRERRDLDREGEQLQRALDALAARRTALERLRGDTAGVPELGGDSPNHDLLERANAVLARIEREWRGSVDALDATIEGGTRELAAIREDWRARRAARATAFEEALRDLQREMPDVDPERYLGVERRIEQLAPLRSARKQLLDEIAAAQQERATLLLELEDARGAKHRERSAAAARLTAATAGNVAVDLAFQGDRGDFLRRLTTLKSGARADALKRMVEDDRFSPREFARLVRERSLGGHYGLPDGQAAVLERSLSEELLLDIEAVELCDQVSVALDIALGAERDYRPLERLSPGQKSTAILLLIMQSSRDPLLIDQPEDDLDNRFVYDDIVRRLRAAKFERQFIIATHNANIPILGDAEQILVLDAAERPGLPVRGRLQAHGAIDREDVRTAAELILEGGQDAFARRREKYGW